MEQEAQTETKVNEAAVDGEPAILDGSVKYRVFKKKRRLAQNGNRHQT